MNDHTSIDVERQRLLAEGQPNHLAWSTSPTNDGDILTEHGKIVGTDHTWDKIDAATLALYSGQAVRASRMAHIPGVVGREEIKMSDAAKVLADALEKHGAYVADVLRRPTYETLYVEPSRGSGDFPRRARCPKEGD